MSTVTNQPRPNGTACPKCHAELRDTIPGLILDSHPEQKNVDCAACGWSGFDLMHRPSRFPSVRDPIDDR